MFRLDRSHNRPKSEGFLQRDLNAPFKHRIQNGILTPSSNRKDVFQLVRAFRNNTLPGTLAPRKTSKGVWFDSAHKRRVHVLY